MAQKVCVSKPKRISSVLATALTLLRLIWCRPTFLNAGTNAAGDRHQRWEQLYTVGTSGFYFRGKLEPLLAFGYSVNAKQSVVLAQTFWHDWFIRNLDLFVGAAIYPGSSNQTDGSFLNYYADRDTVWFRLQYYLL